MRFKMETITIINQKLDPNTINPILVGTVLRLFEQTRAVEALHATGEAAAVASCPADWRRRWRHCKLSSNANY